MWKVALILIFTLITVPVVCFYYDDPLTILQGEALVTLLWVYGVASFCCFIVSSITDNYSQVDKTMEHYAYSIFVDFGALFRL